MSPQITTSFFKYSSFSNKAWGFKMMQFANKDLAKVNGLTFYRLMGSGKGEVLILSQIGLFIAYSLGI
jgi:hypothetical protein